LIQLFQANHHFQIFTPLSRVVLLQYCKLLYASGKVCILCVESSEFNATSDWRFYISQSCAPRNTVLWMSCFFFLPSLLLYYYIIKVLFYLISCWNVFSRCMEFGSLVNLLGLSKELWKYIDNRQYYRLCMFQVFILHSPESRS